MLKQSVWFLGLIFAASCGGDPSFVLDRHNDPTTESEGVRRVRARQNLVYVPAGSTEPTELALSFVEGERSVGGGVSAITSGLPT